EFDLNALADEAIELIQPTALNHKILKKSRSKKIVHGDRARIQQVFMNLISNAIKYSPKASKVEVSILDRKKEIVVTIKDYGIGIPKSDLEKVFNRFYRVHGKREQFQGLGVGLYISSKIVKRHGGKIWVESSVGKGSTFYFTLPH